MKVKGQELKSQDMAKGTDNTSYIPNTLKHGHYRMANALGIHFIIWDFVMIITSK